MSGLVGDFFDSLMDKTCSILAKGNGSPDAYGQASQNFSTVLANVPSHISAKAVGRPKEFKDEKQASLAFRLVFMRPPSLPGSAELTPHHWLIFNQVANPSSGQWSVDGAKVDGTLYNIFEVSNPGGLNHHFEIVVERVIG